MSFNTKKRESMKEVKLIIDPATLEPTFWEKISPTKYFNMINKQLDDIMYKFKRN